MIGSDPEFSVSQFVAALNQTLEFSFSSVLIYGELANFKVSRNRWVYFNLKDDSAIVSFFGSVYALPGPLEDGMLLQVRGVPRLHERYGFSIIFSSITPTGSGSIKRAKDLLSSKLSAEGLFAPERKRPLPYPPGRLGLITAFNSAACADFKRIVDNRWAGLKIEVCDVSVQGEQAPAEIIAALEYFSAMPSPPEAVVLVRGGGSPEDLAAFSSESVTRAVAASRVPTMVAIGHESDVSLAELAADKRAATPSNAAELLVPDKNQVLAQLKRYPKELESSLRQRLKEQQTALAILSSKLSDLLKASLFIQLQKLNAQRHLVNALNPQQILKRGYAIIRAEGKISSGRALTSGSIVTIEWYQAAYEAEIRRRLELKR